MCLCPSLDQALLAKRDALRMLKAKKTWEAHGQVQAPGQAAAGNGNGAGVKIDAATQKMAVQARAEDMFRAATLCAIEGEVDVAIATLHLSFETCDAAQVRPPLPLPIPSGGSALLFRCSYPSRSRRAPPRRSDTPS